MKAEQPAEGILKTGDWGHSMMYKVVCDCHNPDHDIDLEIEADDFGVNITTYVTVKTDYWSEPVKVNNTIENDWLQEAEWAVKGFVNGLIRRLKLTWTLWTRGYVRAESTITMQEQTALNYAETIKKSIKDVQKFRQERFSKKDPANQVASKLAEQSDCV